jgi:hypothetical protein
MWKDFHDRCDDKGATLTLLHVKDTNRVCGGFTAYHTWGPRPDGDAGAEKDEKAFLFSVDIQTIYKVLKETSAIKTGARSGPSWGAGNLHVQYEPLNGNGHCKCAAEPFSLGFYNTAPLPDGTSPLTGTKIDGDGYTTFTLNEIEVFSVSF